MSGKVLVGNSIVRLILLLLALMASPAWADWVLLSESANFTLYYDPATIRVNGNMSRVWEVLDLKEHQCIEYPIEFGTAPAPQVKIPVRPTPPVPTPPVFNLVPCASPFTGFCTNGVLFPEVDG